MGDKTFFKNIKLRVAILEEQPSWDIFSLVIIFRHGLRTDFRVSQEVAGAGQNVRIFLESPFHGLSDGI